MTNIELEFSAVELEAIREVANESGLTLDVFFRSVSRKTVDLYRRPKAA